MKKQCFFKKEVVRQKKKEGWQEITVSATKKGINDSQKLVLLEKKG